MRIALLFCPSDKTASRATAGQLLLLASALFLAPVLLTGQLTTGLVEGTVRHANGHPADRIPLRIEGGAGFTVPIHTDSAGRFTLSLPYGHYLLSTPAARPGSGVALSVAPLQTRHIDLVVN